MMSEYLKGIAETLKNMMIDEGFKFGKCESRVFYFERFKIYVWENSVSVSIYESVEDILKDKDMDYPVEPILLGHIQPIVDWLAVWGVRP